MKKKYTASIALLAAVWAWTAQAQTDITLDLARPVNPAKFETDPAKGHWTETFNDTDYPMIEFEGGFAFTHLTSGNSWGGLSWDGFTYATSGDSTNHNAANDWTDYQWGCMAGGGIRTGAQGEVLTDETGNVQVQAGIPYLIGYYASYLAEGLQTIFTDGQEHAVRGMYVCNHPWSYYNCLEGGGVATAFGKEGDCLKLIVHGLDAYYEETGSTVEHILAEYKDGQLRQSKAWQWVDLSPLGNVGGLAYTMETTDIGEYGPNTATYFCLDRLTIAPAGYNPTATPAVHGPAVSAWPNPFADCLMVSTPTAAEAALYDLSGQAVLTAALQPGNNRLDVADLPQGTYVLRIGSNTMKLIK